MNYTTTLTSKSQITIPKSVRDKLGLELGAKIDILPNLDGSFVGKVQKKSKIMKFAGDLAYLDDGRPWSQVRDEAGRIMAEEVAKEYENAKEFYAIPIKKRSP